MQTVSLQPASDASVSSAYGTKGEAISFGFHLEPDLRGTEDDPAEGKEHSGAMG